MVDRREHAPHDMHDAAKPGSTKSWHVWAWGILVLAGMIALVVAIQAL